MLELKSRWKVSLAAMVRRAYGLGIYSEATYRRAYVQLNERGWRPAEPGAPPMEKPKTLRKAVELLGGSGYPPARIAERVRLHPLHMLELVGVESDLALRTEAAASLRRGD